MDWNAPRRIAVFLIAIITLGSPPATRAQQQKDIYDVNFECSQMNGPLTVREAGRGDGLKDYCAGQFYGGGYRGLPKDTSAAKRYYRLSADAGFVAGQVAVGDEYWPGDYVQAMAWYQKAASQNFGTAQWRIGRLYLYGNGVTKNRGEAIKWYRLAAANGSRDAKAYVAKLDGGLDPERQEPAQDLMAEADRIWRSGDQAAAARPYLAAARASNSKAQLQIGWHYENGIGVPQSYSEAASWYRKAADQGETSAMANLANMYEFGKGVPEDWVQSAKSYKKECQEKNLPHRLNTHPFLSRHSAPLLERALLTESGLPQAEPYVSSPRAKRRYASSPPVGFISLS
jgi:TPR repeat protein